MMTYTIGLIGKKHALKTDAGQKGAPMSMNESPALGRVIDRSLGLAQLQEAGQ